MSDARIRDLERRAMQGDRQAMRDLLVAEERVGRARAGICTGEHHWTFNGLQAREALGTSAVLYTCVRCLVSEVVLDDRRPACPEWLGVAIHGPRHAAISWEHGRNGTITQHGRWTTACGHSFEAGPPRADLAACAEPIACVNCLRTRRGKDVARASVTLYAALLTRADAWASSAGRPKREDFGPPFGADREAWIETLTASRQAAIDSAQFDDEDAP